MIVRFAFVVAALITVRKLPAAIAWWTEFSADYDAAIADQRGMPPLR